MKPDLKKLLPVLALIIIVIVVIVVIVVTKKHSAPSRAPVDQVTTATGSTSGTHTVSGTAKASSGTVNSTTSNTSASGSSNPVIAIGNSPFVSALAVTQTAVDNYDDTPKHGTFSIQYSITAGSEDIYVKPICSTVSNTAQGVEFSMIKDGTITTDNLSSDSCIVRTGSGTILTAHGNYKIAARTSQIFQLIVVDHPSLNGNYRVVIDHIGYANSDTGGSNWLTIAGTVLAQLQTKYIGL